MKPSPSCAIALIARAPSAPGKTRLAPHLSAARLRSLRAALLADVLRVVAALDGVERYLFFTPDHAEAEMASLAGESFSLRPQRGDDIGARMRRAFEELLVDRGHGSAILVGSDIPILDGDRLAAARDQLRAAADVVLGPAGDGGYYLIGCRAVESALFDGIEWGSATVLASTVRAAERCGLTTRFVESAYDIDTIDDLRRLERDLTKSPRDVAPDTRRWFGAASE